MKMVNLNLKTLDKSKLQGKMLRSLLTMVGLILLLMLVVNFFATMMTQRKTTETYVSEIVKRATIEVSSNLDALRIGLESIADHSEVKSMDWDLMADYMQKQAIKDSAKYSMLLLVYPDGSYCVAGKGLMKGLNLSDRKYVQEIIGNRSNFAMTSPDKSKSTGEMKYSIAVPITRDGKIVGCLAANVSLKTLTKIISGHKIGENGYSFMTDEKATVIAHTNEGMIMNYNLNSKENLSLCKGLSTIANGITQARQASGYVKNQESGTDYMICMPIPETPNWSMVATLPKAEIYAGVIGTFCMMCLFMIFILIMIMVSVTKSLNKTVIAPLTDLSDTILQMSNGNLTAKCSYESEDEIGQIAHNLRIMTNRIYGVVKSIREGADIVTKTSDQVNTSSQQLSQGANEQASSIEELSATMEEMVSNIEQNTQNANQTTNVSIEAYNSFNVVAEKSNNVLETNKEIARKILVINDIASKTNILALNAAVEAARAGEYGRGFAVVATEVRKLAEHSKMAADEIIELSQKGLVLSEEVGKVMNETMPKVENTKSLVNEIAAASSEQTSGSIQINNAIQQLDSVIRINASASEGLASSSEQLAQQAQNLLKNISFFKVE